MAYFLVYIAGMLTIPLYRIFEVTFWLRQDHQEVSQNSEHRKKTRFEG